MDRFIPHCPRCDGQVLQDHDERKCLQCGHTIDSNPKTSEFYEYNRAIIEPLIRTMSAPKASKATGIPNGSLGRIKRRWSITPAPASMVPATRQVNGQLPELPAWSDNWPEAVQLAWLGIWLELSKTKREEVKV